MKRKAKHKHVAILKDEKVRDHQDDREPSPVTLWSQDAILNLEAFPPSEAYEGNILMLVLSLAIVTQSMYDRVDCGMFVIICGVIFSRRCDQSFIVFFGC